PDWRVIIDDLRRELGTSIDGEDFYIQARRAVWLADFLTKHPVSHLHAFRSDVVLCNWLVTKLMEQSATPRLSAVIEPRPLMRRSALKKLLPDFAMLSVADERLANDLKAEDTIGLATVTDVSHLRFGPIKLRQTLPLDAFRQSVQRWVQRITTFS
ncbi:MAG: hypothetical protein ACI9R3_005989, partial [Verrucomicrobiales bacterium]